MIEHVKAVVFEDGKVSEQTMSDFFKRMNEAIDELNKLTEKRSAEEPAKESKFYSGRIMCVESEDEFFTVGRIYPCINGVLIDDTEDKDDPYTREIKSFDEINKDTFAKFIEVAYEVKIDD